MHADIAGAPHQIVHDRAAHEFEPPGTRRLPDDDLGDVVGLRKTDHIVGDPALDGRNGERLAAQRLGEPQRVGKPVALLVGQLQAAPRLDAERGPGRMQPVGQPLGVANEPRRPRILADADQMRVRPPPRGRRSRWPACASAIARRPARRSAAAPVRAARSGCPARSNAPAPARPAWARRPCPPSAAGSGRRASDRSARSRRRGRTPNRARSRAPARG